MMRATIEIVEPRARLRVAKLLMPGNTAPAWQAIATPIAQATEALGRGLTCGSLFN